MAAVYKNVNDLNCDDSTTQKKKCRSIIRARLWKSYIFLVFLKR